MSLVLARIAAAHRSGAAPVYATLNPSDKASTVSLDPTNLIATGTTASSGMVRSNAAITGKTYFEAVITNQGGSGSNWGAGIALGTAALTGSGLLGYSSSDGWAYWAPGVGARHAGVTINGNSGATGDVIGFAVDKVAGKIWISHNGVWLSGDPAAGTSPLWTDLSGTAYAAAAPWTAPSAATMRFNPASFSHAAPAGFGPLTV
jgi:hypothetical protein